MRSCERREERKGNLAELQESDGRGWASQEEGAARAEGGGNQLINVIVPEHVHLVALGTEENFRERTGRAKIKEASPVD
jgi:hypothetical protein